MARSKVRPWRSFGVMRSARTSSLVMARLFISRSSWNNDKAIEIRDGLARMVGTNVFLNLDSERDIAANQRKKAMQKAAYCYEVVLALVSEPTAAGVSTPYGDGLIPGNENRR